MIYCWKLQDMAHQIVHARQPWQIRTQVEGHRSRGAGGSQACPGGRQGNQEGGSRGEDRPYREEQMA